MNVFLVFGKSCPFLYLSVESLKCKTCSFQILKSILLQLSCMCNPKIAGDLHGFWVLAHPNKSINSFIATISKIQQIKIKNIKSKIFIAKQKTTLKRHLIWNPGNTRRSIWLASPKDFNLWSFDVWIIVDGDPCSLPKVMEKFKKPDISNVSYRFCYKNLF